MNTHISSLQPATPARERVAVIGSGISGASAAWCLHQTHDVTLFEAENRPGGHTCTVDVDYDGTHIPVDVGFIVMNERNYPNMVAMLDHLDVKRETTNMSFAMSLDNGAREWCGQSLSSVFAQKRNLVSPGFLWMLREVLRFNRISIADRDSGYTDRKTIGAYLGARKFSQRFRDDYLIPMAASIWSTPAIKMMEFPARSFIQFFENHRLLEIAPPIWETISGGSRTYLEKLLAPLGDRLRLGTAVARIERPDDGGVIIHDRHGDVHHFDHVIIAAHSDQALAMLGDANGMEKAILGDIGYKPNRVVLHRDARFMPQRQPAWAAWNAIRRSGPDDGREISLTYWMNRLQNIDSRFPLFVTLNPAFEPDPALTFGEWSFDHPQFDSAAFDAQTRLPQIQGQRSTWFAGAWTGFGFHEDGLKSGLAAARALGAIVPWETASASAIAPATIAPEGPLHGAAIHA